jgi:hypothetical protein
MPGKRHVPCQNEIGTEANPVSVSTVFNEEE